MEQKKLLSLWHRIVLTIVLVGIASLVLLFISSEQYRNLAYTNEQAALAKLIDIKVRLLLENLENTSKDFGNALQADSALRAALKSSDSTLIGQLVNEKFDDFYSSVGNIKLEKLYAFNLMLDTAAISDQGFALTNPNHVICSSLIDLAKTRKGADKIKYLTGYCTHQNTPFYAVLIPVGGIQSIGYIMLVTDPTQNIKPLEIALANPIQIRHTTGKLAYESASWPSEKMLTKYLHVKNDIYANSTEPLFSVAVARDIGTFLNNLNNAFRTTVVLAVLIIIPAIFMVYYLLKQAFRPVQQLHLASERLASGEYTPITTTSYPEINIAINSFNKMAIDITELISKLESEIQQREKIQQQLYDNQKKLEATRDQAIEASKFKSDFLANMSHEIRTPLTAIIGFAESSLDINQTLDERLEATNIIINSGNHLLNIINDILDLSKIEAAKLDVDKSEFSLIKLLWDIESLVKLHADNKGLEFKIIKNFPLPEKMISDSLRIKQVIINLCSNAIKFTEHGYIHVYISFSLLHKKLYFEVVDTGIGLTDEQIDKIFNAFMQADSSTTRKYGGTGLGLSLSKQLTEKLGGEISVKSTYGSGSRFTASFATGSLDNIKIIKNPIELPHENFRKPTVQLHNKLKGSILLAEDNYNNQRLVTLYLKRMGSNVDVTIVDNGRSAVERALEREFDLIFMDMQMPIMGGLLATITLRKKGCTKPIVALTANAMKEDVEKCLKAGCDEFITKPIDRKLFYSTVSKYLEPDAEIDNSPIYPDLDHDDLDLTDVIQEFLVELPKKINTIKQLQQQNDTTRLLEQTHQLKGLGGGMGYTIVSQLAAKIEFHSKNNNPEAVNALIDELENVMSRMQMPQQENLAYPKSIN